MLMNILIKLFDYQSYLEIGVRDPRTCHDLIHANKKVGVDPEPVRPVTHNMTSDEYFEDNKDIFDLIYIDGFHIDDQVTRDIYNSLNCLSQNGTIVMHDCNPKADAEQSLPQTQGLWMGTVWKSWVRLRQQYPSEMFVIDSDAGLGVIRKSFKVDVLPKIQEDELTYTNLEKNRQRWLNLISPVQFAAWAQSHLARRAAA
jgi:hypothetical protein